MTCSVFASGSVGHQVAPTTRLAECSSLLVRAKPSDDGTGGDSRGGAVVESHGQQRSLELPRSARLDNSVGLISVGTVSGTPRGGLRLGDQHRTSLAMRRLRADVYVSIQHVIVMVIDCMRAGAFGFLRSRNHANIGVRGVENCVAKTCIRCT